MRIGIDARLRAYRGGGIPEHVNRLLLGLAGLAPPEEIVVIDHRRLAASRNPPPPLKQRRVATPPHHRLEDWALPLELVSARLDLLHSPDMVVPRGWLGRSVVTVHDLAFLERPELVTADALRYYRRVEASVKRADRIITVSEHTADQVLRHTSAAPEKIRIIGNAVHPRFFHRLDEASVGRVLARYGLERGAFLLFVGTIEPRKNLGPLLDAVARLRDLPVPLPVLALAGSDGWLSDDVHRRAALPDLAGRVRFLGFVPDEDLPGLYQGGAALVHPALDEGFGMTVAEAMACGLPVVAARAGHMPALLDEAGRLVDASDSGAWTQALRELLAAPRAAAAMGDAGRRRAARMTVDTMARDTLAVYREVLDA